MSSVLYNFDIKDHLDNFYKDILSVSSHNYKIEDICNMIISSYKRDHITEMQVIGRFCMYYAGDGQTPDIDMHLMANAIKRLRISLFKMLDDFQLVHMRNENNQFPYELHFKSLTNEYLLIDARIPNHASTSI